ncbi:MAG: hypothetical protein ABH821_02140 [archaeon]
MNLKVKQGFKGLMIVFLILFSFNVVSQEIDLQSARSFGQQYENNEINYLQLRVNLESLKEVFYENLNENLEDKEFNPEEVFQSWDAARVRALLGEPTGYDDWVWDITKNQSVMLDEKVPRWEKTVFDGQKIKITFNAWPHLIVQGNNKQFFYWLDFETQFKKNDYSDFGTLIRELSAFATAYNSGSGNAESLALKAVETQRFVNDKLEENSVECDAIVDSLASQVPGFNIRITQTENLEWKGLIAKGNNYEIIMSINEWFEDDWHGFNTWTDLKPRKEQVITPELNLNDFHNIEEEYRKEIEFKTESELESLLFSVSNEMASNFKSFEVSSSEIELRKAFENEMKVRAIMNVLSERANREESSYSYSQLETIIDSMFNSITSDGKKERVQNYSKKIVVLEEKETNTSSHCNGEEVECGEGMACVNSECVNALGGNETCDNSVDDDSDGLTDCDDLDCYEFVDCGRMCESACTGSGGCWECTEINCSSLCNDCYECNENNPDNWEACEQQCNSCNQCNEQYCSNDCETCWTCQDQVYGSGCRDLCEPCNECDSETQDCNLDCRECNTCKFEAGEFKCLEGEFNYETGNCEQFQETYCGDGILNEGEACEFYEDCGEGFNCSACQCILEGVTESCGNGIIDEGEQCETDSDCGEGFHCPDCYCAADIVSECGNGVCETGEENGNCIEDCFYDIYCGDGECNGNETSETCSTDCVEEPRTECGNGICETGEDESNCHDDCVIETFCGDGTCDNDETQESCSIDCGEPTPECGNGICETGEDESNCPGDCVVQTKGIVDIIWLEEKSMEEEFNTEPEYSCIEFGCNINEYCDVETGWCECEPSYWNCDGDWINGCESTTECEPCESELDCAQPRCSEDHKRLMNFSCNQEDSWEETSAMIAVQLGCTHYNSGETRNNSWVELWGPKLQEVEAKKQILERQGHQDWCKEDLAFALIERTELENSLTKETMEWFFNSVISDNPTDFMMYQNIFGGTYGSLERNTENIARNQACLQNRSFPQVNLINMEFETPMGKVKLWEERKTTDFFGLSGQEIVSPYMSFWFFPDKETFKVFLKDKEEVNKHRGGPSPEEIAMMRKSPQAMERIKSIANEYGGEAVLELTVRDETQTYFGMAMMVSEENLIQVLNPVEVSAERDATVVMNYDFFYNMISSIEKEQRGNELIKPYWEEQMELPVDMEDIGFMISMFTRIIGGVISGDVRVEPIWAAPGAMNLMTEMMNMAIMGGSKEGQGGAGNQNGVEDMGSEGQSSRQAR